MCSYIQGYLAHKSRARQSTSPSALRRAPAPSTAPSSRLSAHSLESRSAGPPLCRPLELCRACTPSLNHWFTAPLLSLSTNATGGKLNTATMLSLPPVFLLENLAQVLSRARQCTYPSACAGRARHPPRLPAGAFLYIYQLQTPVCIYIPVAHTGVCICTCRAHRCVYTYQLCTQKGAFSSARRAGQDSRLALLLCSGRPRHPSRPSGGVDPEP